MTLYLGNNLISGVATTVDKSERVGQIIQSTIPLTDAGLHLLDGALIQGSGIYSDFVDAIADLVTDYPDLFETEANWQSAVTTYGVCGKFVYDSVNNTVRLPKITGILEGTTDLTALGDLVEAGLPNITGTFFGEAASQTGYEFSGAFYRTTISPKAGIGSLDNDNNQTGFDASRSSSIYGNSTTVQPQTIKAFYYIVIATSTKTDIQVDIDEIATDLNGKADVDLTNCTKPHIVETYQNGTSWYRVYSDGWCEQGNTGPVTFPAASTQVAFLKTFADTNYSVFTTPYRDNTGTYGDSIMVESKYTGYFYAHGAGQGATSSRTGLWFACGYIS